MLSFTYQITANLILLKLTKFDYEKLNYWWSNNYDSSALNVALIRKR